MLIAGQSAKEDRLCHIGLGYSHHDQHVLRNASNIIKSDLRIPFFQSIKRRSHLCWNFRGLWNLLHRRELPSHLPRLRKQSLAHNIYMALSVILITVIFILIVTRSLAIITTKAQAYSLSIALLISMSITCNSCSLLLLRN